MSDRPFFRRGSALLVVLGMLAFMLFSGLAFSVYMRQTRLPTSFLRRTVASRQLAKAALAEAIEEIDQAIGNDPHPGVRPSGKSFSEDRNDNFWSHRVFFGLGSTTDKSGSTQSAANSGSYYPAFESAEDTVPTLTLEGLAYLPPNLINEARYFSQRTPTAKWHSFWFDSGRYAYTAIDVSDYFDVNRIYANKPRAACASQRISFAHLFEKIAANGDEYSHAGAGSGADKWDQFMENYRVANNDLPLVSMADFNVEWNQNGAFDFGGESCISPFVSFINNGGVAYSGGETSPKMEHYRMMTFVTDGWFPAPTRASGDERYSLEDPTYQPFLYSRLRKGSCDFPKIDDIADMDGWPYSPAGARKWMKADHGNGGACLNVPNMVALWDYLDADLIPASLCLPTVERTPMICGISPSISGSIDVKITQTPTPPVDTPDTDGQAQDGTWWKYYTREVTYSLDIASLQSAVGNVTVLLTYPFNDFGITDSDSKWDVDGRLSFFLSTGGTFPMRFLEDNFKAMPKKADFTKTEITDNSLISYYLERQGGGTISPTDFSSRNDLGMSCVRMMLKPNVGSISAPILFKVKYRWNKEQYVDPNTGVPAAPPTGQIVPGSGGRNNGPNLTAASGDTTVTIVQDSSFFPLQNNGKRANADSAWATIKSDLIAMRPTSLKLNIATWIRIVDKSKNTVDFVPACQSDDVNMNDAEYSKATYSKATRECGGGGYYPMMRLEAQDSGNDKLELSLSKMENGSLGKVEFPEVKWITSDPRYNYAPENWVQTTGGTLQESDWRDDSDIQKMIQNRDGDAFMATSDAGYMQSVYELAFLPRVSEGFSANLRGANQFTANIGTTFNGAFRTSHTDAKDADLMWKTYNPMGRYRNDEFLEFEDVFETSGMAVNPYSNSKKVLMAAFANTPHDWRMSATNFTGRSDAVAQELKKYQNDAPGFNKEHAWCEYAAADGGAMCWECLEDFADRFQAKMKTAKSVDDWIDLYADLGWSSDPKKILTSMDNLDSEDGDNGKLYSVDKKFFYGFWHDCFAARQQLFLIFVRAEPMMMGGGVSGQTPPQLGAHAVALVWRDPTETERQSGSSSGSSGSDRYNPHRTRILFYHQFD